MNAEPALREIVQLIVRCVDPEEVFLFGSIAKRSDNLQSDADLLVIGRFAGPRHRRGGELRGLLDRFALRIDLHLLTREEFAAEAAQPHSWLDTLRASSVRLYPR
jgi:predicted nucleotidyltransferase